LNFSKDKIIACEDFNAHHEWWNSKITRAIRSEKIVKWVKLNKLNLINKADKMTWSKDGNNSSKSVIDLTFASKSFENLMINWSIDKKNASGSDHAVIKFELITSSQNSSLNSIFMKNKYNLKKTN